MRRLGQVTKDGPRHSEIRQRIRPPVSEVSWPARARTEAWKRSEDSRSHDGPSNEIERFALQRAEGEPERWSGSEDSAAAVEAPRGNRGGDGQVRRFLPFVAEDRRGCDA